MFIVITPENRDQYVDTLRSMHRLRHRIFIEELKWPLGAIQSIDGMEFDQFDTMDASYIVRVDDDGEVNACARLMSTSGPNLLWDVFPELIETNLTRQDDIWEITRFCADRKRTPAAIVGHLVAAMLEYALDNGIRGYVSVSDVRIEPVLRRYGWSPVRLGEPRQTATDTAAGETYEVSLMALNRVRQRSGLSEPLLPKNKSAVAA